MKITFKLFASLGEKLPPAAQNHAVELEVPKATTPEKIIDQFAIAHDRAHLVLVNGVFIEPGKRNQMVLKEGDTLAIWPPVAGG